MNKSIKLLIDDLFADAGNRALDGRVFFENLGDFCVICVGEADCRHLDEVQDDGLKKFENHSITVTLQHNVLVNIYGKLNPEHTKQHKISRKT